MAVASRVAVVRVVAPDGNGRRGRQGFAVVGLPVAAMKGRRRGRAVAASPPTEEVAQMTEPLTKEDLVAYLASGCKPKENWRRTTGLAALDSGLSVDVGRRAVLAGKFSKQAYAI